jgi:hypothetical protein
MSEKKNYHTVRYGTAEGEIQFGHIHADNVRSGVMLRSGHSMKHYITMDGDGKDHRKFGTICRSPGSFQVKAGDGVPDEQPGIYMDAVNGDIVIRAASGRIRLEALDISLKATDSDNKRGNITIDAQDKVIVTGQNIAIESTVASKFFSENKVELVGNGILNLYGGFLDLADGATSIKGSKNLTTGFLGTEWEIQNRDFIGL